MSQKAAEITIVIADDHPIVRRGLREGIEEHPGLRVVGEASDGASALEMMRRLKPRIALLDISMPEMTGLQVAEHAKTEGLATSVIILTVYDSKKLFSKAIELGVMGYMLKDSVEIEIIRAIQRVAEGDYFISPAMSGNLVEAATTHAEEIDRIPGLNSLTPSERRILQLIAADKATKEIAEQLNISTHTVNTHRANMSAKLHLSGSFSLLRFALEHKEFI